MSVPDPFRTFALHGRRPNRAFQTPIDLTKLASALSGKVMAMDQKKTLEIYLVLMEEVKIRFSMINDAHQNHANLPVPMVREICYLQFRFICEIIALGCLVVHGDIPEAQALKKTYEPGKILKKLERLNPHFYPQPIELKTGDSGYELIGRPDINHLTKHELPELWGRAGDVLHRSPMVKMFEQMKPSDSDFSDIFEWSAKLSGLLNSHSITLVENKKFMRVSLLTTETGKAAASVHELSAENVDMNIHTVWVAR